MQTDVITFKKITEAHQPIIFQWLDEPHMREFWDNSQEHRDDILNFIYSRKRTYFFGTFQYWISLHYNEPFAFVMSDNVTPEQTMPDIFRANMSKQGNTVCIDFGIGNPAFIGRGLAAETLSAFMAFYRDQIDPHTDTFFIDPDTSNPRARHVYEKAGFEYAGEFNMETGVFMGHDTHLLVKRF